MSVVEDARTVVELGGGWLQRSITTLVAVLRSAPQFVATIDFNHPDAIRDASLFAAFVSLLGLALDLPLFRVLGVQVEQPLFVVADTVLTYAMWFGEAVLIHFAARLFRVRVPFQRTLIGFFYLTGLLVPGFLIGMPATLIARRQLIGDTAAPLTPEFIAHTTEMLLASPVAMISAIFAMLYGLYILVNIIAALKPLYGVGRIRAIGIGLLSAVFYLVWNTAIEVPVGQMLWRGFHQAG
jgi:hypothetical protein